MLVLIAGGGTGGHLFPGIALAEELMTRHPNNEVVFVGTARGLEAKLVPASGYRLETIRVRGLKGVGILKFARAVLLLPLAFLSSWLLLRKYKPDVVVGVGGYASGPVVLMARLLGIPTAVQEQNAVPGFTNRVLGRFVRAVFIAFEEAGKYFARGKVYLIGNPIRRSLLDNYLRSRVAHDRFTILVFGGSLGAAPINRAVLEALDDLDDIKSEIHFIHQTGESDLELVQETYEEKGFSADVIEFIDDMSSVYAHAELVICRAGAITLAEITVCKKAAILIPFPHATDNHQEANASTLVTAGAAILIRQSELTGKRLAQEIRSLKASPERLKRMEKQAGLLGRPEAAKELADICVEMMVSAWGAHGRRRPDKKVTA